MTERVPTEAEWGLVAGVMKMPGAVVKNYVGADCWREGEPYDATTCLWYEDKGFNPFEDSNDLDALVRVMQAAGYTVSRWAWAHGYKEHETVIHHDGTIYATVRGSTDNYATTFAIIDALAAEAEKEKK